MDQFTQHIHQRNGIDCPDCLDNTHHSLIGKQRSRRFARRALKIELPIEVDADLDPTPEQENQAWEDSEFYLALEQWNLESVDPLTDPEDLRVPCLELEPLTLNL